MAEGLQRNSQRPYRTAGKRSDDRSCVRRTGVGAAESA